MTVIETRLVQSYIACKDLLNRNPASRHIQDDGRRALNEILSRITAAPASLEMQRMLGLIG